jgi:hypothetical protein
MQSIVIDNTVQSFTCADHEKLLRKKQKLIINQVKFKFKPPSETPQKINQL